MRPLRVLAVDDEPIALDRVGDMIANIDGVELVGSVQSGAEALEHIRSLQPDLLLLDIEMPRLDGFDVVESLSREKSDHAVRTPLICFVTAYPQYASTAYETGALDFLCKPIRLPRLEKAIARARLALEQRESIRRLEELSRQLDELRRVREAQPERAFWVRHMGERIRLDVADVDWVKAEGEYVRLHAGDKSYLLRTSIAAFSSQFGDAGFVRVHRSAAVNSHRLRAVRRTRSGTLIVLTSAAEIPVGRKFRKVVDELLSS
jgi:DNA-binding LytR/AlgR family response regulator